MNICIVICLSAQLLKIWGERQHSFSIQLFFRPGFPNLKVKEVERLSKIRKNKYLTLMTPTLFDRPTTIFKFQLIYMFKLIYSNKEGKYWLIEPNCKTLTGDTHSQWDVTWFCVPTVETPKVKATLKSPMPRKRHSWAELWSLTILANIHADGVDVGEVGRGRPHAGTGGPHVVEEEDRHGGEAEHAEPSYSQNVRKENELRTQRRTVSLGSSILHVITNGCPEESGCMNIPFHWCSVRRWWS